MSITVPDVDYHYREYDEVKRMNTAKIIAMTQPTIWTDAPSEPQKLTVDEFIAYVARVSNPQNQNNTLTAPKLLRYLAKHKHWSPFEMVHVVMEINTTRDIGRQILRHRSFTFQEFSQRYADPTKDMGFTVREARLQDLSNRQNSVETSDEATKFEWQKLQCIVRDTSRQAYEQAIAMGVAKEQARAVLPEGLILSRMYMAGSLRSWIHYCQLRMAEGTQKEHREIAIDAWYQITEAFPSLKDALDI
jgi:thymidylate synthase (FAD)